MPYTTDATDLRKDITYIISTNWIRFILLGFIPFILLVILYANIYSNLQKRKSRSHGKYIIAYILYSGKKKFLQIIVLNKLRFIITNLQF